MQIEHKTEKGTICFFLPPSEADRFKFFNDEEPYLSYFIGAETFRKRFQKGFKLIGLSSEVTEEQAKPLFDEIVAIESWDDYSDSPNVDVISRVKQFKSLMQHLHVYEVNPFKKPLRGIGGGQLEVELEYYNAEKRTGKWIVLFKPND